MYYWQDIFYYSCCSAIAHFTITVTNLLVGKSNRTVKHVVQLLMRQMTGKLEHLGNECN